jgi:biopolymer transport protein ExbD
MSTTRNIVVRFISVMTALLAAAVITAFVSPAQAAYASIAVPCGSSDTEDYYYSDPDIDWEINESNYDWLQDERRVETSVLATGLSDIGRAEGIIVEDDTNRPYEPAITVDLTPGIQLICTCVAAIIPLAHFTRVAIATSIRDKRKVKAARMAQAVKVYRTAPVKSRAVAMRICKTQTRPMPAPAVRQPVAVQPQRAMVSPQSVQQNATAQRRPQQGVQQRPQRAMVFAVQPMHQMRRYPIQQQQSRRQQVQRQQSPTRRIAPAPMYA